MTSSVTPISSNASKLNQRGNNGVVTADPTDLIDQSMENTVQNAGNLDSTAQNRNAPYKRGGLGWGQVRPNVT